MSKLKRGDEAPRPKPWRVLLHSSQAARGWTELQRSALDALDRAWVDITGDPRSVANPHRQHRLKASLRSVKLGDRELEQWQYEVTAGGRIWYLIDDETRTLWITKAAVGHPGVTDKGGGRRSR
ncbi:hypothetical protein GV791_01880 [Nocardia cyriacigeorgica]|uniref:Type II toxin-antitoxin system RelE/ParE family toxin n=1 Tax=Nocardia cyriacigeorgica TaxID=135487 RepID=A0A6P1CFE3_9NOCA|nr:hypothetical protein [Nocardia cyriacigeorgica]MBF6288131.1 hypothetical protein [Nocardia cyriacigeorgica]NEW31310.1 hypothetical protein [Nocardia cyriacigeorgica]